MIYPIYVSYATKGDPYESHLAELEFSAQKHDLLIHASILEHTFASWQEAAAYKRFIIRHFHDTEPNPIVWLDADARIRHYPDLFDELANNGTDFAACWRGDELLSGTLFFGKTEAATRLIELWDNVQKQDPKEWDQRTLAIALKMLEDERPVKVFELPVAYCFIFDRSRKEHPDVDPVIEHLQASRQSRLTKK